VFYIIGKKIKKLKLIIRGSGLKPGSVLIDKVAN